MKTKYLSSLLVALAALIHSQLSAGVVFTLSTKDLNNPDGSGQAQLYVDGKNLKMDFTGSTAGSGSMIFRGEEKTMLMIDNKRKQYVEMDEAAITKLSNQMNQAMAQMNEALKNVPPAQRAMMENMMKERMGALMPKAEDKIPTTLEKGTKNKTIAGYDTKHFIQKRGNQITNEFWIADWKAIKEGENVMGAFKEMSAFLNKMMDAISQGPINFIDSMMDDNMFQQLEELGGFPVSTIDYDNGSPSRESTLESIEAKDFAKSTFAAPKGFKKQRIDGR